MPNPAAEARAIRRSAKDQHDVQPLLQQAEAIGDPAQAAPLLAQFAVDPRLTRPEQDRALATALERAEAVERLGQKAEMWQEMLGVLNSKGTLAVMDAAVAACVAMPDGQWKQDSVRALAPLVHPAARAQLLDAALDCGDADGVKAVLDAGSGDRLLVEKVRSHPDPDLRRRALGRLVQQGAVAVDDAVAAAWQVPQRAGRLEALRALVWGSDDVASVERIAESTDENVPDEAALVLCTCIARADRLGRPDRAETWAAKAVTRIQEIDDQRRAAKAQKKLQETLDRLGGAGASPARAAPAAGSANAVELPHRTGSALALVNAYSGALGTVHLRAAARGAALCSAFGHDLWLVGFPTDLTTLVQATSTETSIGEDARPLEALAKAGRLKLMATLPEEATVVATTPHPGPGKRLEQLPSGPICLAVGLGKQGLPNKILNQANGHYELTGRGVSLETATAMGILADRLAASTRM